MRDTERILAILEALELIWLSRPDQRFEQLLSSLGFGSSILWHYEEDDDVLKRLQEALTA